MTRRFRRHGDRIRMHLDPVEVDLLRSLQAGLEAVLRTGDQHDPVVARLFPATVTDDPDADAELRALLYEDLLADRLDALNELLALLDRATRHRGGLRIDLDAEESVLVLGVLNDLRLAMGARAGEEVLRREDEPADATTAQQLAVMDHLAWLQEQLLAILDPPSVRVHEERREEDLG